MAVHPLTDELYVTDPESHKIYRILNSGRKFPPKDIENNFEVFVGSGLRCLPGLDTECGDGGRAINAKLIYPKGLVIDARGRLFFTDGPSVRMVDEEGLISTVVGGINAQSSSWRSLSCAGVLKASEVGLKFSINFSIIQ